MTYASVKMSFGEPCFPHVCSSRRAGCEPYAIQQGFASRKAGAVEDPSGCCRTAEEEESPRPMSFPGEGNAVEFAGSRTNPTPDDAEPCP